MVQALPYGSRESLKEAARGHVKRLEEAYPMNELELFYVVYRIAFLKVEDVGVVLRHH